MVHVVPSDVKAASREKKRIGWLFVENAVNVGGEQLSNWRLTGNENRATLLNVSDDALNVIAVCSDK